MEVSSRRAQSVDSYAPALVFGLERTGEFLVGQGCKHHAQAVQIRRGIHVFR
ncbi:MAG TPA: hypothetical protein PLO37_24815 [Candidatus Hydrogenedentes bacterium]|nr:hypothetical protein [Candidatus Hydrogenedentota bacterium]HPG70083.1 hypothetical protein [Candidatus Hydrogenedentota bacterium]